MSWGSPHRCLGSFSALFISRAAARSLGVLCFIRRCGYEAFYSLVCQHIERLALFAAGVQSRPMAYAPFHSDKR